MSGLSYLCVVLALCCVGCIGVDGRLKCDAVKSYFEAQGFPASDIPKDPISCKSDFLFYSFNHLNQTKIDRLLLRFILL